jgi:hypothetical protein
MGTSHASMKIIDKQDQFLGIHPTRTRETRVVPWGGKVGFEADRRSVGCRVPRADAHGCGTPGRHREASHSSSPEQPRAIAGVSRDEPPGRASD